MPLSERQILERLRAICLEVPEATESVSFGHPTFNVRKKSFAVLETYKGELSICCKVGLAVQDLFLKDPRFYKTPYIGKHGWVSLRTAGEIDWEEVAELVRGSRRMVLGGAKKTR